MLTVPSFDPPQSRAFAVADHQVAHIIEGLDGVAAVWGEEEKRAHGLDHARSGELVAIAQPNAWFTYYYWLDDRHAPDFARTVDIHRKPGYDPVELFLDPAIRLPKLAVARRLLKRKLGLRTLMDVIPLDAALVRGSHGRADTPEARGPVVILSVADALPDGVCQATDVKQLMLEHIFGRQAQGESASAMRAVR